MREIPIPRGDGAPSAADAPPSSNLESRFKAHCEHARQILYARRDEIEAAYTVRDDLLTALNESGGTEDVYALAHRIDVSVTAALVHLSLLQEQGVVYVTSSAEAIYLTLPGFDLARQLRMPSSMQGPAAPRAFSAHVPATEDPQMGEVVGHE